MAAEKSDKVSNTGNKKILENTMFSSISVPIAIVLVGALVVAGITKLISTEQNYRDLVYELESKQFGNKWVNAYELSKLLATKSIPEEEMPWLIEKLSDIYSSGADKKTRNFLIVALASLNRKEVAPTLELALKDVDDKTVFSALVGLGNLPTGTYVNWSEVEKFLESKDPGLTQAAILTLCAQNIESAEERIAEFLSSENLNLRFAAATGLIYFKNEKAKNALSKILSLEYKSRVQKGFNEVQIVSLKMNVLNAIEKVKWKAMLEDVKLVANNDQKAGVAVKAKQVLNLLKN